MYSESSECVAGSQNLGDLLLDNIDFTNEALDRLVYIGI